MTTATVTRRIPKFHQKLRTALESAGLPETVEVYVDGPGFTPDPSVILQYEYRAGHYAKAFARTDAHERGDLDAKSIVDRCVTDAERTARDSRYTLEARMAAREFSGILREWLATT